jgi:hypothetical protein
MTHASKGTILTCSAVARSDALQSTERLRAAAEEEGGAAAAAGGKAAGAKSGGGGGLLSAFVRSIATSVVGTAALTAEDIAPALVQLKRKLMERNVAEGIAEKCAPWGPSESYQPRPAFCTLQDTEALPWLQFTGTHNSFPGAW